MFEKGNDITITALLDDKSMYNLENYYKEISKTIFTLTNGKTVDEYIGLIVNKIIHSSCTKFDYLIFMNAIYYAACDKIGFGIKTNGSCPKETILHILHRDNTYEISKTEFVFKLALPIKYRFKNSKYIYNYTTIIDIETGNIRFIDDSKIMNFEF